MIEKFEKESHFLCKEGVSLIQTIGVYQMLTDTVVWVDPVESQAVTRAKNLECL